MERSVGGLADQGVRKGCHDERFVIPVHGVIPVKTGSPEKMDPRSSRG